MNKIKKIISYIILAIAFSLICIGIAHADTIVQYENTIVSEIEKYKSIEQLINDNYDTYFTDINKNNDIVIINGNTTTNEFYLYVIQSNITISNSNGYFSWSGYTYHIYTNPDYTGLTSVDNWGYWSPNTSYVNTMFGGSYSFTSFGQDSTLQIINNSSNVWTFSNYENTNSQIILNADSQLNLIDVVNVLNGNVSNYPTLEQPIIEQFNGYTRVTFKANDYTRDTIEDYNVMIENLTNATRYYMQPTIDSSTQASYVLDLYENTTIKYYVLDLENEDILEDYFLSITVDYDIEQNFKILINSIDNNIKKINYTYQSNDNNTIENYTCFHQVMGGQEIQDNNCTYSGNNYNLILNGNENVTFKIYDNENNLIYQHNENFIFNLSDLYITFNENYINNFSNLEVRIHNYQNGYIVKYTINDSQQYTAELQDLSSYDNSKIFNINNLNKNSIIKIYVYDSNNNIIANSQYEINIYRNYDAWNTNFNINNIFNSLNIKNIASELLNYIQNIGNNLISTKIGNLILLEFFGSAIILILKLIRR